MHEGHRSRLVGRVVNGGALYPHELLEVLLFPACPRKDMNPVAHRLLDRFKTLDGVLSASEKELMQIEGVGEKIAGYLVCLGKCVPNLNGGKSFALLKNSGQFERFLSLCPAVGEDVFGLHICDSAGRVTRICNFRAKDSQRVQPTLAEMVKCIALSHAYGVFAGYKCAHGTGEPTDADDELAKAVRLACRMNGARFYDYVVCSPSGETFSYFVSDRLTFDGTDWVK